MRQESVCNGSGQSDIVFHEPGSFISETCAEGSETSALGLQMRVVRHCAPTLAGMKCGSMFRLNSDPHDILSEVRELEKTLSRRGVRIDALQVDGSGCLLYVYRPKLLEAKISDPAVRDFLTKYGYCLGSVPSTVAELTRRFSRCSMPPEVGVFLDYPLEDVTGYIENEGRCCKSIGCWKVYGDVSAAEKRFRCFKKCKNVFVRRFEEGSSLERLAVRC